MMVLLPIPEAGDSTIGLATLSCGTDNQGNSYLLDKLMTTKFPLGVVLMELSSQLHIRRACLHARWIPRLQNEEADALTNGEYDHFDEKLRIPVDLETLEFKVMNSLFGEGEAYVEELSALKKAAAEKRQAETSEGPKRKVRKGQPLSVRQPW